MRFSRIALCFVFAGLATCRKALPINGERCTAGQQNCVCDAQTGACFIQGATGGGTGGSTGCTPLTCTAISATCGEFADTCTKTTVRCGDCDQGQVCQYQKDASGNPTSSTCIVGTATSCSSLGYNCGTYTDPVTNQVHNCTQEVNGGQPCASGTSCGGGGQANVCGCTPLTCQDLHRVCGDHDGDGQPLLDGCGGTLNCDVQAGGCSAGNVCNYTAGQCEASTCTPYTCAQLGNPCGQVSDGCGGLIACAAGECAQGSMCDPTSHQCLSLSKQPDGNPVADPNNPIDSVACQGRECGYALDACSVDHLCENSLTACCSATSTPPGTNNGSTCTNGYVCIANECEDNPTDSGACPPGRCGANVKDPLGKTISACGSAICPSGQLCEPTTGYCMDPGPTTCVAQGKNCGTIYWVDASGDHSLDCGDTCPIEPGFENSFPPPDSFYTEICGGGGTPGVCALPHAPIVCIEANAHCGTADDACGNQYTCGQCVKGNKCAGDPSTQGETDCQACQASDYFTCSSPQYLNKCGNDLADNCAGTINCGCPDTNTTDDGLGDGKCLYGACYTKSTGTVACGSPDTTATAACACTPDPNVCKNANACEVTLPDDGCGHPVNCGNCQTVEGDPATTVCEQDNKTCCAPNANVCQTSCSPTAQSECDGQINIDCQLNLTKIGTQTLTPAGCTSTTNPTGDTGENDCVAPCNGHPGSCEGSGNSWACCPGNVLFSSAGNNCCSSASYELSTCADANEATDCPGDSCSCQTTATGLCCQPWTCSTYEAAHPHAINSFYAANTLSDGCGGKIATACNFCDATDHYASGGAATSDGIGGTCCQCQPFTATNCSGNCNEDLGDRTCTPTQASGEAAVCNVATVNTSSDFKCTAGNVCPSGDVCYSNACCAPCGTNDCNETKCGVACNSGGCPTGTCDTTTDQCCTSGIIAGGVCCAAGQVNNGGVCCTPKTCTQLGDKGNAGNACGTVSNTCGGTDSCACGSGETCDSGNVCCPTARYESSGANMGQCCASGTVFFGGACCTPKTCSELGDNGGLGEACSGISDSCGGTLSCACTDGASCTSGTCQCPAQHTCGTDDCGEFNGGACNAVNCGTCASNSDGKTTCSGNTCVCPGVSCGNLCNTTVGSGSCQTTCNCSSGETCSGTPGTCSCPAPVCPAGQCSGSVTNSCGGRTNCNAACPTGAVCNTTTDVCCPTGVVFAGGVCCASGQVDYNNACCSPHGQPADCPCGTQWNDGCGGAQQACDTCSSGGG